MIMLGICQLPGVTEKGDEMLGIKSYGAYIPLHRLSRAEISRAWGGPPLPGEKAVANYDEDSLTMAVAACRDCLRGADRTAVDGLYFASTTFPYREKQSAAVVATPKASSSSSSLPWSSSSSSSSMSA